MAEYPTNPFVIPLDLGKGGHGGILVADADNDGLQDYLLTAGTRTDRSPVTASIDCSNLRFKAGSVGNRTIAVPSSSHST